MQAIETTSDKPNAPVIVRSESATDFMLRNARTWEEWLAIGEPCSMARIRECIRRYPKPYARHALRVTCMRRPADKPQTANIRRAYEQRIEQVAK